MLSSRLALRLVSAATARADLISISPLFILAGIRPHRRLQVLLPAGSLAKGKEMTALSRPLRNCLRALCVSFRKLETKLHQLVVRL